MAHERHVAQQPEHQEQIGRGGQRGHQQGASVGVAGLGARDQGGAEQARQEIGGPPEQPVELQHRTRIGVQPIQRPPDK